MFKRRVVPAVLALLISLICVSAALASAYVGNARSYKFHYSDCRYVGRMNESNKVFFGGRDEAINAGYVPCKVCSP